jgi:hypothetical protein
MRTAIAWLAAAGAVAGCATQVPQTAEEFRRVAPGAFMVGVESFEVLRPLRAVGETFSRRAPACLNMTVRTTSSTRTSYQVIETAYKPTVVLGRERVELHIQQKHLKGVLAVAKEPADGRYLFVVDAHAVDRVKTRVQIIGPSRGYDVVIRAIKAWADGSSTGCPDLTKIG